MSSIKKDLKKLGLIASKKKTDQMLTVGIILSMALLILVVLNELL